MTKQTVEQKLSDDKAAALAAYNHIVEHAELLDIRLTDLKFSVKPNYYPAVEKEAEGKTKLSRTFDHSVVDLGRDVESGTVGGRFVWALKISQGKSRLVTVDASFFAVYRNVPDVGQEHIDAYVRKVGRFATYPYFRALVAQMSWESSTDLPIMPVLK